MIVFAVPVGPRETIAELAIEVDQMVCLGEPRAFFAVGASYVDFSSTSEQAVVELLELAVRAAPTTPKDGHTLEP